MAANKLWGSSPCRKAKAASPEMSYNLKEVTSGHAWQSNIKAESIDMILLEVQTKTQQWCYVISLKSTVVNLRIDHSVMFFMRKKTVSGQRICISASWQHGRVVSLCIREATCRIVALLIMIVKDLTGPAIQNVDRVFWQATIIVQTMLNLWNFLHTEARLNKEPGCDFMLYRSLASWERS